MMSHRGNYKGVRESFPSLTVLVVSISDFREDSYFYLYENIQKEGQVVRNLVARKRRNSMNEGIELGWLRLIDKSDLVLTTLHVLQHQDRRIFGESHAIIPRKAI